MTSTVRDSRDDFDGTTKEDLMMVISDYRGNDRGLQAFSKTELTAMLKRYREMADMVIKRERQDDDVDEDVTFVESRSRKRRCTAGDEVVELG